MTTPPDSVLLDTNVIIEHLRRRTDLTAALNSVSTILVPWVVAGELYYGACRALRSREQHALIEEFLRSAVLIVPTRHTSEKYGRIKADLAANGRLIPDNDVWIAAIAIEYGLPLATRDAHFDAVRGLNLLRW